MPKVKDYPLVNDRSLRRWTQLYSSALDRLSAGTLSLVLRLERRVSACPSSTARWCFPVLEFCALDPELSDAL